MKSFFLRLGVAVLLAAFPSTAGVLMQDRQVDTNVEGKPVLRSVAVKSVFSHVPVGGFFTLITEVENNTGEDFSLTLRSDHPGMQAGMETESTIVGTKGKKTKAISYHMTCPSYKSMHSYSSGGRHVILSFAGAGMKGSYHVPSLSTEAMGMAFSTSLTDGRIDAYNSNPSRVTSISRHGEPIYADFSPSDLPADWRAFHGFSIVCLTSSEWTSLTPGVRDALTQYMKLGGQLWLFMRAGDSPEHIQAPGAEGKVGLGKLRFEKWDGSRLEESLSRYHGYFKAPQFARFNNENSSNKDGIWPRLLKALGERDFGAWLVAFVLIAFAVLVGPINLFVLAPQGRRHRLFFTTPLISLGAALVLIAAILMQDGLGGNGVRRALVFLDPEDHSFYTQQSEVSRSGLLLSSGFELKETAYVAPALLNSNDRWTRLKADYRGKSQRFSVREGKSFSGDYFQSRSLQGLGMEYLRSTRGRIELVGSAAAPKLQSSLDFEIPAIVYFANKQWWTNTTPLGTGKTVELKLVSNPRSVLTDWGINGEDFAREGCFYAIITDKTACDSLMQNSLGSIEWSSQKVFLIGEVSQPAVQP